MLYIVTYKKPLSVCNIQLALKAPFKVSINAYGKCKELRTFARKFSTLIFFWDFYHLKLMRKNGGSPTSFRKEQAGKNTLNLKNRASLVNKATMSVSPKIIQLDLWSKLFSAKYCSVNWWASLKNKFVFSDHSFTRLAAARWQNSMSRGQKS